MAAASKSALITLPPHTVLPLDSSACGFAPRFLSLSYSLSLLCSLSLQSCLVLTAIFSLQAQAQVNVTTWHNDIGRTGQNLNETILNTTNVNATSFGKLFSQPVDGMVYAEPLYLSGITVNSATHNVVFIATEHDSVYAFDADNNTGANASPLWKASLLATTHGAAAGATTVSSALVGSDISPEIGITGTPVIDPATGTLYVVSKTYENSSAVHRLHALDVTTGLEKFGGPVVVTATISGTGSGSVNGTLTFDQLWENQRPGLLLLNGMVYVSFASHGDSGPWHGWILSYNAATLKQAGVYCASPNGTAGGFWMSGAGLAADQLDPVNKPFGRMFVATGNGDYNATKPYTNAMDYGDTHLNLDLTSGVPTVTDEFTTNQQASLNSQDGDVGSGGLMVVPTQTGTYPHVAVQAGKAGTLFLLNRDNLGGYNTTTDQALQEQAYAVGNVGVWSSPAYWNGNVYMWGRVDYLKSFALANGKLSTTPTKSSNQYGFPGATPSISANGSSEGIVWTIDSESYGTSTPAILEAHNASDVATLLYSSATNAARDKAGVPTKFAVPTIANGKVYVGTSTEVDVYGLLNATAQTASPVLTPGTESFSGSINVTITDATTGAAIHYTTDGTTPTTSSATYSAPIAVSATETISALAIASGATQSAVTKATYTLVVGVTATPTFSPAAGSYTADQKVTLADATAGAKIYYTTNGTTPTTASNLYSAAITVSTTQTIKAIAVATGDSNSAVASAAYTIVTATPTFSPAAGSYTVAQKVTISDATAGAKIYYTTNGTTPTTASTLYSAAITVSTTQTIKAIAVTTGDSNSAVASAAYTIVTATPTFSPAAGSYTVAQKVTLADATAGAKIYYTTNGTTPTTASTLYSAAITVSTTQTIKAIAVATGDSNSAVASAAYTIVTATPTFSPAAGSYTVAQKVTLADATAGAKIYYTTNGTTPTTASTLYSAAITVSTTETIKAIAVTSGDSNSAVASAAYTIGAVTPIINYASAFTATNLNLYGATIVSGALLITNGKTSAANVAWYTTPVSVQKFTTDFTFVNTSATADGFTFALQNASAGIWAVGGNASQLGYGGIPKSVAIKFDLYNNSGEGSDSTGLYINGAIPTVPSYDMTSSGVSLHSGHVLHAHLTYNGTTLTLTLTDTTTNAVFTGSLAINIPSTVGANTAYVGFTGGTGGLTATQAIKTWTYTVN